MSSVIFQPLLHDPLGWKASNTTYADHYQWRKQRLTRKDKIVSPYGQKFQRELQRQKEQQAKSAHRSTPSLIVVPKIEEEPIPYRISSVKKVEEEQEEQEQQRKQLRPSGSSKSIRQTSSKSLRIATPEEVQSTTSVEAPVAVRSTSPTRAASVQRVKLFLFLNFVQSNTETNFSFLGEQQFISSFTTFDSYGCCHGR